MMPPTTTLTFRPGPPAISPAHPLQGIRTFGLVAFPENRPHDEKIIDQKVYIPTIQEEVSGRGDGTMKITSQEEYGLRCLLRLARAEEGHSLTIPEIAAAEGLSGPYVAKILAVLRQGGLIDSARGRAGGYRLAQPPADITLGRVLSVLGEPLFDDPGYCERHRG